MRDSRKAVLKTTTKLETRQVWIDALKGIGIIMVVLIHTGFSHGLFEPFIVPLFFLGAGVTFSPKPPLLYFKKSFLRLMVPYYVFMFLISYVKIYGMIRHWPLTTEDLNFFYEHFIYGGINVEGQYVPFWFIPVLWISDNILNLILRYKVTPFLLFPILGLAYYIHYNDGPGLLNLRLVPFSLVFLWTGYIMRPYALRLPELVRKYPLRSVVFVVTTLFLGFLFREELLMDMRKSNFGIPVVTAAAAFLLSIAWAVIAIWSIRWKYFTSFLVFCNEAALIILFLHLHIHLQIPQYLNLDLPPVFSLVLSLAVPLTIYKILQKLPVGKFLFGIK